MKPDDLLAHDAAPDSVDEDLTGALAAFGFVSVTGTLFYHPTKGWLYTIAATNNSGHSLTWIGIGKTPADAEQDAIDALAKWILNQQIPSVP